MQPSGGTSIVWRMLAASAVGMVTASRRPRVADPAGLDVAGQHGQRVAARATTGRSPADGRGSVRRRRAPVGRSTSGRRRSPRRRCRTATGAAAGCPGRTRSGAATSASPSPATASATRRLCDELLGVGDRRRQRVAGQMDPAVADVRSDRRSCSTVIPRPPVARRSAVTPQRARASASMVSARPMASRAGRRRAGIRRRVARTAPCAMSIVGEPGGAGRCQHGSPHLSGSAAASSTCSPTPTLRGRACADRRLAS